MRAYKVTRAGVVVVTTLAGVALASPPMHNSMGARFKIVSKGPTSSIEITLKPLVPFDTVRVEAGSGVASLTPCSFTAVVPGSSYTCRVDVSQKPDQASLTLNVVGERVTDPAKPRFVEVRHFTLANSRFVAPAVKRPGRPSQEMILTSPQDAAK